VPTKLSNFDGSYGTFLRHTIAGLLRQHGFYCRSNTSALLTEEILGQNLKVTVL
jgi:hypothetical protein